MAYRRGDVNVHCIASPEDVVTLIFVVAYRRGGAGGGGMLTFMALRHQKLLLRWRCCRVESFDTLKMLNCCCVEHAVVILKVLLRWRCCYVDGFDTLKMLLRWKCWNCFQNGIVDVKSKKHHVHFAHGSLVDYNMFYIFMLLPKKIKLQSTRNSTGFYEDIIKWRTWQTLKQKNFQTVDNISQVCCPHVELIPYVVKLWKDHKRL